MIVGTVLMRSAFVRRGFVLSTGILLLGQLLSPAAWSAETQATEALAATKLVVKLATTETLPIRSRAEGDPTTIILEFPQKRVAGSLPERAQMPQGAIQEIRALYAAGRATEPARWLRELHIQLRGSYQHVVRTEPGRIIVEIQHPAAIAGEALELGLVGGVGLTGVSTPAFSERFRAMQLALENAAPIWTLGSVREAVTDALRPPYEASGPAGAAGRALPQAPFSSAPASAPVSRDPLPSIWWWVAMVVVGAGVAIERRMKLSPRIRIVERSRRGSAGLRLIDQLVWRAFERQGHQLLQTIDSTELPGTLRLMTKDQQSAALLCIGDAAFCEKGVVEQFAASLRKIRAPQGYLVAPSSFTVPAQRYAKENQITLIGRDQVVELLSDGAVGEHFAQQLEHAQQQLEEARETLSQSTDQLEAMRQQRNESSWFLGEERAKNAKLDAQLIELSEQLGQFKTQAEQWQEESSAARKQLEESQWFLGEAKALSAHIEEQLRTLADANRNLEERITQLEHSLQETQRQRDESRASLEALRPVYEALRTQVHQLTDQLSLTHEDLESAKQLSSPALESVVAALKTDEAESASSREDRRRTPRVQRQDVTIELRGAKGKPVFKGLPRNLCRAGFGFDVEQSIEALGDSPFRVAFYLPNRQRPVTVSSRLVWQQRDDSTEHYVGGCAFVNLPPTTRKALERAFLETSRP